MKNKLGADVQYIEINFILMGTISSAAWTNNNLFSEKWVCVKITKPSSTVQYVFPQTG